jgi:anti-sigma regulatory factor (Ser/Thr protein kinase)/FixJ family two-component response regulator
MQSSQPHILLADSDTESQDKFRAFFKGRGWELEIVRDASHLGKALQFSDYDVIIADVAMPGLSPSMLLGQAFRRRPTQALVMIGDSPESDGGVRLLRSGVTDVITKPVDFAWLERCVEQACSLRRQDEREKQTYAFVTSERTVIEFSCGELREIQAISLPIVGRLLCGGFMSENEALRLRLAIQEAILNAIEHGNLELDSRWKEVEGEEGLDKFTLVRRQRLEDPRYAERRVRVTSEFEEGRFQIVIKDEGPGFLNSKELIIPLAENLSCFGRGMTLIKNAVDELRFRDNGSEVTLIKYLQCAGS